MTSLNGRGAKAEQEDGLRMDIEFHHRYYDPADGALETSLSDHLQIDLCIRNALGQGDGART